MHKEIKKFGGFLVALAFLGIAFSAQAANMTLLCGDEGSSCDLSPAGTPLFNELNVAPGQSYTKTFDAVNDRSGVCSLYLSVVSTEPNSELAKNMFTAITSNDRPEYGIMASGAATNSKTFYDIYRNSPVDLGSIDPHDSKSFSWNIKLSEDTPQSLSAAGTNFDISFNVQCETSGGGDGDGDEEGSSGPTSNPTVSGKSTKKPTPGSSAPSVLGNFINSVTSSFSGSDSGNLNPEEETQPSSQPSPEVKGASTVKTDPSSNKNLLSLALAFLKNPRNWFWVLVVIAVIFYLFLLWKRRKKEENKDEQVS